MQLQPVRRVDAIGRDELERDAVPVVVTGGARGLAAMKWTADYLAARVGDVEVRHKRSRTHAHPDFHAATLAEMFATGRARIADLLAEMASSPRVLFTGDEHFLLRVRDGVTTRSDELRALADDVELPALVPADRLYTVWAWFSGAGVRTWLHYDNNGCHNLNAQLTGEKRCWLFAPDQLSDLAPFAFGGGNPAYNCCSLDADAPLPDPLVAFEATLSAGDLLFIPAWWIHTFTHLGAFNSNVNFWWRPERPADNPVARRQHLLDLLAQAGVDARADDPATVLANKLDQLAIS